MHLGFKPGNVHPQCFGRGWGWGVFLSKMIASHAGLQYYQHSQETLQTIKLFHMGSTFVQEWATPKIQWFVIIFLMKKVHFGVYPILDKTI